MELQPVELVEKEHQRSTETYEETFKGLQVGQLGWNALESVVAQLHDNQSQTKRLPHKETYPQSAQRSQVAYLSWQTNEAIVMKLEDGASETESCERRVSPHTKLCQRRHAANGSGQRRQEVPGELQMSQRLRRSKRKRTRLTLTLRIVSCVNASTHAGTSTKQLSLS
jgi:hypothetical protein